MFFVQFVKKQNNWKSIVHSLRQTCLITSNDLIHFNRDQYFFLKINTYLVIRRLYQCARWCRCTHQYTCIYLRSLSKILFLKKSNITMDCCPSVCETLCINFGFKVFLFQWKTFQRCCGYHYFPPFFVQRISQRWLDILF